MRIRTIVAFSAGYVLGTRAGRQRYAQIVDWFERATSSRGGQALRSRAEDLAGSSLDVARRTAASTLSAASDRVRQLGG